VPRAVALALAVVLLAATVGGCGRETNHDVQQSILQISSIASEGAIMADDLASDRSKITYVRVHGEELSSQAEHEAEKLNDAPVAPELRDRVKKAVALAGQIGGGIDNLRTSPQDRHQAFDTVHQLLHWSDEARKLADSI
jgi:predicted outer membrane protein